MCGAVTTTEYAPTLFPPDVTEPVDGRSRHSDPQTSRDAGSNKTFVVKWGGQRAVLLQAYADLGPITDEQAGLRGGIRRVADTRRCSELRKAGLIEPTGTTRPTSTGAPAQICRITTQGVRALLAAGKPKA